MDIILTVESITKFTGGIGQYTLNLLKELRKIDEIESISCFAYRRWIDVTTEKAGQEEGIPEQPHRPSLDRLKKTLRAAPFAYSVNSAITKYWFQRLTRSLTKAVYHEPNFILKPFAGPKVATFHDLSFILYPQYHPAARIRYMEKNLDETLKQADHFITDSEFVRKELITSLGINESKVTAIPLGVSSAFKPRSEKDMLPILSRYNLKPGKYFLSVATLEPRKNLNHLLDAYLQLEKKVRTMFPLVIVGADGWRNTELKDRIKGLEHKGEVIRLGYVPNEDLPVIFSGTRGFIFVPYYEGFGLPPLEAMASGVPILTSNVSSIPEVVGDIGLLVDPDDIAGISAGIKRLALDEDWVKKASVKGVERAAFYSWSRCADSTVDVYKTVLGRD